MLGIYKGTCQARIPPRSWRETQNQQVELDVVGCLTVLSIREENKGEREAVWGGGSQLQMEGSVKRWHTKVREWVT